MNKMKTILLKQFINILLFTNKLSIERISFDKN